VKLTLKLGVITTLFLALTLGGITGMFLRSKRSILDEEALRRARTVISFGEACREYARNVLSPAVEKHTSAFIPEARSATFLTRGVFSYLRAKMPEYSFREASLNPLNPANFASEEEKALITRFHAEPALQEITGRQVRQGREEFFIARPIVVKAVCLQCHDTPEKAPPEIVERYGSTQGYGWKEGDVTSALIVGVPSGDLEARHEDVILFSLGTWGAVTLVLLVLLPFAFHLMVGRRLRRATKVIDEIVATSDLGVRIGDRGRDEVGWVCSSFDQMTAQLAEEKEKVRTYTRDLETLVEERTQNLEAALERAETEVERQERTAQALLESEERYRLIIHNSLDAAVAIDEDGIITDWNPQATALFGWSRDEAIKRPLSETIIPARYREEYARGLERYRAGGEGAVLNRRVELPAIHKDGREMLLELTVSPLQHHGKTFFSGFLRDITERKRAEKELHEAMEMAEAANKLKSSFLANVSHEIRTPMTAIMGYASLLKDRLTSDPEALEDVETIERSGLHLLQLINDILDLSKIEAGQFELERIPCSPRQIVEEVVQTMRVRAEEKGISLLHAYETPVPEWIMSDPTRIRQVLLNLAGNAVKFTEAGSVVVAMRFDGSGKEKRLELRVEDTGIGIPVDKLPEMFKPFTQLHAARNYGGTGLGLSISYRLAQLLGGHLRVESKEGKGSVFRFSFPVEVPGSARVPALDPSPPAEAASDPGHDLSGARILVAEDTPANQSLMRIQLARCGATVDVAEDGKVAVERCTASRYDLIIMDIHMPVMDGFQALQAIRSKGIDVPVMAVTASAMAGEEARCRAAGFSTYLAKPVRAMDLVREAKRMMAGDRA
jgi:PAS domain S-box-containing protein